MSFTIVAVRHGISIFNRRASPRDALFLASARVQEGVEAVRVFGAQGEFIAASALAEAARRQSGATSVQNAVNDAFKDLVTLDPNPPERRGESFRVGGDAPANPAQEPLPRREAEPSQTEPVRTGRVRVFRAKSSRD